MIKQRLFATAVAWAWENAHGAPTRREAPDATNVATASLTRLCVKLIHTLNQQCQLKSAVDKISVISCPVD